MSRDGIPDGPPSLLTPAESEVVAHLARAWNAWMELEKLHPNHHQEFLADIHSAQRLVMARPVQREFNAKL